MTDISFTPRETVASLDRYIIGQRDAKRAVAIALRNRWRRQRVPEALRDEIAPKNIILMGPTGCGKTEIARRLAKLAQAPFVKVEATKFTEVGYVGRDVESMVRDLIETSVKLVKEEAIANVKDAAKKAAEDRLLDVLLPKSKHASFDAVDGQEQKESSQDRTREKLRDMMNNGGLDDREVELNLAGPSGGAPMMQMFGQPGMEDMAQGLQDALSSAFGQRGKAQRRKMKVPEALKALESEEAQKLIDIDEVQREAVRRAEQSGIIFVDEIDKVAGQANTSGANVSREGVQRDILPIVEGSTVNTKYGPVKTDHVLFIAAGAFHMSKPSDLIPELQGRFPIRVELHSLTEEDFVRILQEPENSLMRQYVALLATEGVTLDFTDDGLRTIAEVAAAANANQENIGARRLHTVMEHLLDDISFDAPEKSGTQLRIDADFVAKKLKPLLQAEDLSRFIL